MLSIIAAMANNRVIGKDNAMPWHLPADLQHFKQTTWGKPIIMGRKTFESIGRVLPGRRTIVVTRNPNIRFEGCDMSPSLPAAIALAGEVDEVMVVGGGQLYQQALPLASRLYLTLIEQDIAGDVFFPEWDTSIFHEVASESHAPDDKNPYPHRFVTYDRVV